MYTSVSNGIRISVTSNFRSEFSDPSADKYVYSYEIEIENIGTHSVQLLTRKWVIFDSLGRRKNIEGKGVIGKQPIIRPGENYSYTSWCPLHTSLGYMEGSYEMKDLVTQDFFQAEIPRFILATPEIQN